MNSIRHRNSKRKKIDGYTVACAAKKDTGLPYDVLLDSLGADKRRRRRPGIPRIGVVVNDMVIHVSIADPPVILSGTRFEGSEIVLGWVARFRAPLLKHWNKELNDLEILTILAS